MANLARFDIIVATDSSDGISFKGSIPWRNRSDMKFFKETTQGRGNNAVIMGRKTYLSIDPDHRPLVNRRCVVLSKEWKQESHPNITVCDTLTKALQMTYGQYDSVFIAGGESVYQQVINDFLYLCDAIYVTRFKKSFKCDQFFSWGRVQHFPLSKSVENTLEYKRYILTPEIVHDECGYLSLMKYILENGEHKSSRTGIDTKSVFGCRLEFDISTRLPLLTTKQVPFKMILKELLFFISGKTDTHILLNDGIKIWEGNTSRQFLDNRGLTEYEVGDMGAGYGFQWRHWGAEYRSCTDDYTGQGIDQLEGIIKSIQEEPHSRRHILTSWNVSDLDKMALPPCHMTCQFNVSGDGQYLDCQLYQRSADMFLGVPFNIASYSILTYMIAHLSGLKPRKFIHVLGDAHVYNTHIEAVRTQLKRTPLPFPKLNFKEETRIHNIDDFNSDNVCIEGYESWSRINAPMAV